MISCHVRRAAGPHLGLVTPFCGRSAQGSSAFLAKSSLTTECCAIEMLPGEIVDMIEQRHQTSPGARPIAIFLKGQLLSLSNVHPRGQSCWIANSESRRLPLLHG